MSNRDFKKYSINPLTRDGYIPNYELSILSTALAQPEHIKEMRGLLDPSLIDEPAIRNVVQLLWQLDEEGRKPSIEAVLARMNGEEEIEPDLTVREWLTAVLKFSFNALFVPWSDAIETLIDSRIRGQLGTIGQTLAAQSQGSQGTREIAQETISAIDDVLTIGLRVKRSVYTGEDAAGMALTRMRSTERDWPTTGFTDLDKQLGGGWPRGQLSVVAARPGVGKSAFVTSTILRGAKKANQTALFFSLEMNGEQLGSRLLCDLAYQQSAPITYDDMLAGRCDEIAQRRLEEANDRLQGLPILIDEQPKLTLSEIEVRSRKHAAKLAREGQRLDLLVVDHIGLMGAPFHAGFNRHNQLHDITSGLMALAKELNCATIALCQLNRGVEGRENKRPDLPDLRESGSIEENASVVVFLYREAYYLAKQKEDKPDLETARLHRLQQVENDLEAILAKNRNGRPGIQTLFCAIGSNAIRDRAFGGNR